MGWIVLCSLRFSFISDKMDIMQHLECENAQLLIDELDN